MNICLLTAYTDKIRWDDYGKCDYGDFASTNHLEYANIHGYSFYKQIVQDSNYTDRHPTWIKIDILRKILPLFDYVAWIDADAVFTNNNIKIEEFIEEQVDLVLPKAEVDITTGNTWSFTSTGFMIWKNSQWSMDILNKLWNEPNEYTFKFLHEQTRLDQLLFGYYCLPKAYNVLNKLPEDIPSPLVLGNVKILPYLYHRCFTHGDIKYIFHAGGSTPTKYKRIKEILEPKEIVN